MSVPLNPLDGGNSSSHRHILIAFEHAEDAFKIGTFDPGAAIVGDKLQGDKIIGRNVVVVNELLDRRFSISEAMWDFNYTPAIGVSTSSSVGRIVVSDRRSAYSFLDFLRDSVLSKFALGTSLSHVTFVLKTIFTASTHENNLEDIIAPEPFFFNIDSIESVGTKVSQTPSNHILNAIGVSNSLGCLPAFSSLNQFSITHKDGNISANIPSGGSGGGITTRGSENGSNSGSRKSRLDLSKPMATLKDLFDGFEADLNQQRYAHKGQLQRWIREIRSDGNIDKIRVAPKQNKGPDADSLPITFSVDLDSEYEEYSVDNRNMPFEQPDVIQEKKGIRVYPISAGTSIITAVEQLMLLSKAVGQDAVNPTPKTFKTTVTAIRTKKEYKINIKIRKYILPENTRGKNTGPGKARNALEFNMNDARDKNSDIISMRSNINYRSGDTMLEQQNEGSTGAGIVFADREQATSERIPELDFYNTLYSGVRNLTGPRTIDGLESAQRAGDIYNLLDISTYSQTTDCELIIRGNPHLLSDLNRNPADVVKDMHLTYNYYPLPENDPMYVKLTIFEQKFSLDSEATTPLKFYFDDYYHLSRVVHIFGNNNGVRNFRQYLALQRTDDLI
jgi:hypothetical protein